MATKLEEYRTLAMSSAAQGLRETHQIEKEAKHRLQQVKNKAESAHAVKSKLEIKKREQARKSQVAIAIVKIKFSLQHNLTDDAIKVYREIGLNLEDLAGISNKLKVKLANGAALKDQLAL
jgi:hypothetical protein